MAARGRAGPGDLPPIGLARQALRAAEQRQRAIEAAVVPALDEEDDELENSTIYKYLTDNHAVTEFTQMTLNQVEEIWRLVDPIMTRNRHRGPVPLSSTMDHVLLFLTWLKSGSDYAKLAKTFKMSETRLEDDLNRVRGPLRQALEHKWWNPRPRPILHPEDLHPAVGLIIDGHTSQISPPKLNYLDQQAYYDGKNKIYGYKTEVAVMASPPYYCLFVSEHVPGSLHDYELHKRICATYGDFLQLTQIELEAVRRYVRTPFWPIMGDKGYTGSADDTEPLVRIVPTKGNMLTQEQVAANKTLNSRRVSIECFFGRLCRLWDVFCGSWRYDEANFDDDFTIACLLTNESIAIHNLQPEDGLYFDKMRALRTAQIEQKAERRRVRVALSKKRKRDALDVALGYKTLEQVAAEEHARGEQPPASPHADPVD